NTYTFKNDITHDQCFDLDGPPPPEGSDRCGDPWFAPVRLSTDWGFYRVPFSELRQEGYGKEFPALEKSAVTMVRFTWQQGWLDDARFSRATRCSRDERLPSRWTRPSAFSLAFLTFALAVRHAGAQGEGTPEPGPQNPPAPGGTPAPAPGPGAPGGDAPQNPET